MRREPLPATAPPLTAKPPATTCSRSRAYLSPSLSSILHLSSPPTPPPARHQNEQSAQKFRFERTLHQTYHVGNLDAKLSRDLRRSRTRAIRRASGRVAVRAPGVASASSPPRRSTRRRRGTPPRRAPMVGPLRDEA